MKKRKTIENIIINAVQEINERLPKEQQISKTSKKELFGKSGQLDSLGLVNLLVIIEQNIEDEFDVSITIADEKAMSQRYSPFRTIGTLTNYLNMLLNDM